LSTQPSDWRVVRERGGRSAGGGGGGGGGGSGLGNHLGLITSTLTNADFPQDVLAIVGDHLLALNHVHVSTAFNRLGKVATRRDFSPLLLTDDDGFQALLRLATKFAEKGRFDARHVATTTHGIAKLHAARRLDTTDARVDGALKALECDVVRVATAMNSQNVANTMYAYAALGRMPGDKTCAALDIAAARVAQDMKPQEVANTVWAYATLGRAPGNYTWSSLETAAGRVAPDMIPQDLASTMWGHAKLGKVPRMHIWAALETTLGRLASRLLPQDVANLFWAYATLGWAPGPSTWAALQAAAVRVARSMTSQDVSTVLWANARLGGIDTQTWTALEIAAARVAPGMTQQQAAETLHAYTAMGRKPVNKTWAALETAAGGLALDMDSVVGAAAESSKLVDDGIDNGVSDVVGGTSLAAGASGSSDPTTNISSVSSDTVATATLSSADASALPVAAAVAVTSSSLPSSSSECDTIAHERYAEHTEGQQPPAPLTDESDRWIAALPKNARQRLTLAISAAQTPAAKLRLVAASAEADTTKVRALARRALLDAHAWSFTGEAR
jgi:hypothetical protein